MDNLTHAAIGVVIGRGLKRREGDGAAAAWVGALASNLPDIDLITRPLFADPKLGYLVHHRGHTHTLVVALLMSPLAAWLGGRVAGRRWAERSPEERRRLYEIAGVGGALHIGADAMNNYGVHPFWPVWSDWIYGDRVFIVEPLLLAALLPYCAASAASRGSRWAWGLAAAGIVGLALSIPMVHLYGGLATLALALGLGLLQRNMARLRLTVAAALAVLGTFWVTGGVAERRILAAYTPAVQAAPSELSLTPMPANPLCWSFLARHDGGLVETEVGILSLWPALISTEACALRGQVQRTAPMQPVIPPTEAIDWQGRAAADPYLLREWASDCRVAAFLRFGRMPTWFEREDRLVLGDLRYDFEPGLGFAEIEIGRDETPDCSWMGAPWMPKAGHALQGVLSLRAR